VAARRPRLYSELDQLLDLDGEIFPMDNGYWTKIEAKIVEPNIHIPHGIKYSLTLHERYNNRVLGYDNSHGIKSKKKRIRAKRAEWDHRHGRNTTELYKFNTPGQLLEDFWRDVIRITDKQ